ncbi:VOC family protein [Nocardioides sp. YIM 152588]|uniref:VOC family protein n=1 Tax=Nocardioides sp. YIM 152588 TaxID=3158259 RepID=UPI0032E3BF47
MASQLNPYLSFRDTARPAMEFYREVLGGELEVHTFAEFGNADAPFAELVMHARLETPAGFTLMAADAPPGMTEFDAGSQITVSLSGDDEAELRGYWDGLADGAKVTMPLEKQVWGDVYGQLVDRFGISWMVNIASPQG